MPDLSERMYYDIARAVAKQYGLFIVVKPDNYLVYRSTQEGKMFIGKRKKAKALHAYVKQLTGHK